MTKVVTPCIIIIIIIIMIIIMTKVVTPCIIAACPRLLGFSFQPRRRNKLTKSASVQKNGETCRQCVPRPKILNETDTETETNGTTTQADK